MAPVGARAGSARPPSPSRRRRGRDQVVRPAPGPPSRAFYTASHLLCPRSQHALHRKRADLGAPWAPGAPHAPTLARQLLSSAAAA